jgi:hypothetical protein
MASKIYDIYIETGGEELTFRSVTFETSSSQDMGARLRETVFDNFPEASDYTFHEISSKEQRARDREERALRLASFVTKAARLHMRHFYETY